MINKTLRFSAWMALLAAISMASAFADDMQPQWEISGGATANLNWTSYGNEGGGKSAQHSLMFAGEGNYYITPALEATLALYFNTQNQNGNTGTAFTPMVGPTYNFMGDAMNSCFVGALVGPSWTWGSEGFTQFAAQLNFGKRFELFSHVSWKPEFYFQYNSANTNSTQVTMPSMYSWNVVPFQFTVMF